MSESKEILNLEQALAQITELEAANASLTEALEAATTETDSLKTALSEISEQVALQSTVASPKTSVVKIGKQNYTLHGLRFIVPGFGNLTASELIKNQKALQVLLDRNSGALVKI